MIKAKFQEVATLVSGGYYTQAGDECANGVSMVNELAAALDNLIVKLNDTNADAEVIAYANQIKNEFTA